MPRIIKFIIDLTIVSPIMVIYKIHLIFKLVDEIQDPYDLESISTEDQLEEILKPHMDSFYEKYKIPLYSLTTIIWIRIISSLIINHN